MLTATDSFIEYLAAELTPLPVIWVRQTANKENAGTLNVDALNVRILGFWEDGEIERGLVSLDLLGSDERTTLANLKLLRDVLIQKQFTPELDYSLFPDVPQPTGRAVSWEAKTIRFLNVRTPSGARYVHYNATFPLVYTRE